MIQNLRCFRARFILSSLFSGLILGQLKFIIVLQSVHIGLPTISNGLPLLLILIALRRISGLEKSHFWPSQPFVVRSELHPPRRPHSLARSATLGGDYTPLPRPCHLAPGLAFGFEAHVPVLTCISGHSCQSSVGLDAPPSGSAVCWLFLLFLHHHLPLTWLP